MAIGLVFVPLQVFGATTVTLKAEKPFAWIDEPIRFEVHISDPPRGLRAPSLPAVVGLKIRGPGAPATRTQIINGAMSRSLTYTFEVSSDASKSGQFTVGPAVVPISGGRKLHSQAFDLRFYRRPPPGIRFECAVTPPVSTLGSPFRIVYTAHYSQRLEGLDMDVPLFNISELRVKPIVIDRSRDVSRERVRDQVVFMERGFQEGPAGVGYYTLVFGFEATPLATGTIHLAPATLLLRVRTGKTVVRRGLVFAERVPETKDYEERTEAKKLEVRPLPLKNRPASFNGAIGKFGLEVSATPTKVDAFDPITLEMTIRGRGNLQRLPPPPLAKLTELTRDFDVSSDVDSGDLDEDAGTKVFRQVIRPRHENVTQVPPIPLSYWDVRAQDYATSFSEPIPLEVRAVNTVDASDAIPSIRSTPQGTGAEGAESPHIPAIFARKGIAANFPSPGKVRGALDPRAALLSPSFLATLLSPPAFFYLLFLLRRRSHRDPALVLKQRAWTHARARIADSTADYEGVSTAFQDYFRDRLGLTPGELTPGDLSRELEKQSVPDSLRQDVSALLDRLLAGRFGGARESSKELASKAVELLQEVERCLR